MGVPRNHPFIDGFPMFFPYEPSILGYPHVCEIISEHGGSCVCINISELNVTDRVPSVRLARICGIGGYCDDLLVTFSDHQLCQWSRQGMKVLMMSMYLEAAYFVDLCCRVS